MDSPLELPGEADGTSIPQLKEELVGDDGGGEADHEADELDENAGENGHDFLS